VHSILYIGEILDTFRKRNLRIQVKERLNTLPEEFKRRASLSICQHLLRYLQSLSTPPSSLLGYIPQPEEPDSRPFYREVASLFPHLPIGFPRVEGEDLAFYRWTGRTLPGEAPVGFPTDPAWEIGSFGIPSPSPSLPRFGKDIPWGKSPLVLVPGRVFDRQGGRIGRGKGYYDRFLRDLRQKGIDVKAVGICFFIQLVEEVPRTESDEPIDQLITEEGIV